MMFVYCWKAGIWLQKYIIAASATLKRLEADRMRMECG